MDEKIVRVEFIDTAGPQQLIESELEFLKPGKFIIVGFLLRDEFDEDYIVVCMGFFPKMDGIAADEAIYKNPMAIPKKVIKNIIELKPR